MSRHNESNQSLQENVFLEMKILGSGGQRKVYLYQNSNGK